jgi:hypothetical protein
LFPFQEFLTSTIMMHITMHKRIPSVQNLKRKTGAMCFASFFLLQIASFLKEPFKLNLPS